MMLLLRKAALPIRHHARFLSSPVQGDQSKTKPRIPFTLVAWGIAFSAALYWMIEDSLEEPLILPAESTELQRSLTEDARQRKRMSTGKPFGQSEPTTKKSP
jgi:hypothetical protein